MNVENTKTYNFAVDLLSWTLHGQDAIQPGDPRARLGSYKSPGVLLALKNVIGIIPVPSSSVGNTAQSSPQATLPAPNPTRRYARWA